jgi:hypothetical protein
VKRKNYLVGFHYKAMLFWFFIRKNRLELIMPRVLAPQQNPSTEFLKGYAILPLYLLFGYLLVTAADFARGERASDKPFSPSIGFNMVLGVTAALIASGKTAGRMSIAAWGVVCAGIAMKLLEKDVSSFPVRVAATLVLGLASAVLTEGLVYVAKRSASSTSSRPAYDNAILHGGGRGVGHPVADLRTIAEKERDQARRDKQRMSSSSK